MISKIWGIKADIKANKPVTASSILNGIKQTADYIDDEEKEYGQKNIEIRNPFESESEEKIFNEEQFQQEIDWINQEKNIVNVLDYMKNEHKTRNVYVSGFHCNPETVTEEFWLTKEENLNTLGKTPLDDLGNQAFHIVQSFPDDLHISDEEVHQCGLELCKKLEMYQAVVASHLHPVYDENGILKGKCKHNHILMNSHRMPEYIDPLNPEKMKYNDCKETYAQLRTWNDEISLEHGFPIILNPSQEMNYSWYASEMENQGKSWKKRVRLDIENIMQLSSSWEEYQKTMKDAGYEIKEGKYETYLTPDKQHKIRGNTLGTEYTREYMESYWQLKTDLQRETEKELSNNKEDSVSYENLKTQMEQAKTPLFIEIPRINKRTNKPYIFKYPLIKNQEEIIINTYIKEDSVYSLYQGTHEFLGQITGSNIKDILLNREHTSYQEQKLWEEFESERKKKENIEQILEQTEEENQYQKKGWNNSKTGLPYHIGLYDENGKRRSLLEQVFILAAVVITNEIPDFALSEKEKIKKVEQNPGIALIIQPPSEKMKKILEAMKYAKEENIENIEILNERINNCGKEQSKIKTAKRKNDSIKEKMEPINMALNTYEALKEICESIFQILDGPEKEEQLTQNSKMIEDYKAAKATLFHYKIDTTEKQNNFKERYLYNKNHEIELNKKLENMTKQYTKLKKIKYQVDLAMNKNYCYNSEEEKEQKKEKTSKKTIY